MPIIHSFIIIIIVIIAIVIAIITTISALIIIIIIVLFLFGNKSVPVNIFVQFPFVNASPKGLGDCAVSHFKSDSGENNEGDVTEIVSVNKLPRGGIPVFGGLASSS